MLRVATEIPASGDLARLRTATLRSVAQGGIIDAGDRYRAQLRDLYADIDHVLRFKLKDFEAMIGWTPRVHHSVPRPPPPPPPPPTKLEKVANVLAGAWAAIAARLTGADRRHGGGK